MNILKGAHRLMVGEFFFFSKVYHKYYVNVHALLYVHLKEKLFCIGPVY